MQKSRRGKNFPTFGRTWKHWGEPGRSRIKQNAPMMGGRRTDEEMGDTWDWRDRQQVRVDVAGLSKNEQMAQYNTEERKLNPKNTKQK